MHALSDKDEQIPSSSSQTGCSKKSVWRSVFFNNQNKSSRFKLGLSKKHMKRVFMGVACIFMGACALTISYQKEMIVRSALGPDGFISEFMKLVGFTVGDVLIEGRRRSSPEQIISAVNLDVWQGQSIIAYNTTETREKLLTLPWIESVDVEIRLPRTLHIRLTEREPLALWQVQRRHHLIDREGRIVPIEDLSGFLRLPVVIGESAPKATESLLLLLASEPDLARRVSYATRVGDRRWNIQIDGDIEVRLPEENEAVAWSKLAQIEREQGLLKRDIAVVDLRLNDRMVVQMAPVPVPAGHGQVNRQRGNRG